MSETAVSKLVPKPVDVVLDGEVSIPKIDFESISDSASKLGMQMISANYVRELSKIGGMLNGHGVIRLATGGAFVSQQVLLHALKRMQDLMDAADDELQPEYAPKIGYLADKLARVSATMVKMTETARMAEAEAEKPKRRSFTPCTVIQNNYYSDKGSPNREINPNQ